MSLGVGSDAITYRLATGRLHGVFAGAYAVGHRAVGLKGEWMAAVLASGEDAVLSHGSAASLWGLRVKLPAEHEVTIPRSTAPIAGLRRHRSALRPDETALCEGIPITCVARTLFDVAACALPREFERAVREAEFLRLAQVPTLEEVYRRRRGRRGAKLVGMTLESLSRLSRGTSRSSLEDRFLRFLAKADLPMPETNVNLHFGATTYQADCIWREQRLVVELDGHEAHRTRSAFEHDRERDRRMHVAGWRVIRVTWRQLSRPEPLTRDLRRLLVPAKPRSYAYEAQ